MSISVRFEIRRDSSANFASQNPVLLNGEPAWETDTDKMKFGNGSTPYNSLPYFAPASGVQSLEPADTSVVVGGTGSAPTVRTNTLDVLATQHPAVAAWSNNGQKITDIANGASSSDAAAFGQVPQIDTTATDIQPLGGQAAGSTGKAADAGHVHPATGLVTGVSQGDASIVVGGSASAPTIETGTLSTIATLHPPSADWSNNGHKITGIGNGTASSDAAAFGQVPVIDSTSSDIQALGTQAAGTSGKAADAKHVHPLTGLVTSVTNGDASIVLGGTAAAPTIVTATLDEIATLHPPAGNWSNNGHKITDVLNGTAANDVAAFGQIPVIDSTTGDIQPVGTSAAAGSTAKAADAGHIHEGVLQVVEGAGISITSTDSAGHGVVTVSAAADISPTQLSFGAASTPTLDPTGQHYTSLYGEYIQWWVLTGNPSAISFLNWLTSTPGTGQLGTMELWLTQDGTGSRIMPWVNGTNFYFPGDLVQQPTQYPGKTTRFILRQIGGTPTSPTIAIAEWGAFSA